MEKILNVRPHVVFDDRICQWQFRNHQPAAGYNFKNGGEIQFLIQYQNLKLLPSESYLHITGRLCKPDNTALTNTKFVNNGICHLFDTMTYKLNSTEIDECKNVGLTTTMKGLLSLSPKKDLINSGWMDVDAADDFTDSQGFFDVCIPLKMIFGFAEDFQSLIINCQHELVLRRAHTDLNAIKQRGTTTNNVETLEDFKIELTMMEWCMPYITVSKESEIDILNKLGKGKQVAMGFRSWDLYEYPTLPTSSRHIWTVKTSSQLEKPRFIILGFQTNKKNNKKANCSNFDHCNIRNVKAVLNSVTYPYHDFDLNIPENKFSKAYNIVCKFQAVFYDEKTDTYMSRNQYINSTPLYVIDCSKQDESLKSGPVDVCLEFDARENFPANTSVYCLIIHDRIVEYNSLTGEVKKVV